MTVLDSQTVQPNFIKMRWMEPYVSSGLNRKTFKSLPRGIYSGFTVEPGPSSAEVTVKHTNPDGLGAVSGFLEGSFDPATSGWSVAVHSSMQGFNTTVAILDAPGGANDFVFDLEAQRGTSVFIALDVQYQEGFGSSSQVKLVDAASLDQDPTLLNLARVDVPSSGDILNDNVVVDDPVYPRVLPFANKLKYGFMSKRQSQILDELSSVSGVAAFVGNYIVEDPGPQTIPLPDGNRYTVDGEDLWVFKNGKKRTKNLDYFEVNRGDGFGEEIVYADTLRKGDLIETRTQPFSSVLTSRTKVFDEYTLISSNTTDVNFTGSGVTVIPDGPNRVRVVVPGGGPNVGASRTKANNTGSLIQDRRAVSLLSDNSIRYFDTTNPDEKFYGITLQDIPTGVSGDVATGGIVAMAGLGIAGDISDDVYISQSNDGTMTTSLPDAASGQVYRVGFLDAESVGATSPEDILIERERLA